MTTRTATELPIQFGPQALFGLYHPAAASRSAVLLCPPIGQDQIRSHRLYRQLAQALAAEGRAVLRYDCYGTGDSPGDGSEVDWRRCVDDTVLAAEELRRLSGCAEVVAFGARLGGSLALVAAPRARFARLVAWDAVLDGSAYVAQVDAMQERLRHDPDRFPRPRAAADAAGQWLGFPASDALRAQMQSLRVERVEVPTLMVESPTDATGRKRTQLAGADVRSAALRVPVQWDDLDRLETTVLSHELIEAVCANLREGD